MHQHRDRRIVLAFVVASALLIPVVPSKAQTPADNTKVNTRDRAKGAATADQQKENTTDREITQKIRRAAHGRQDAVHLRPQREGHRSGRTGDAQGAGPDGGREEDRRGQGDRSGG